MRRFLLWAVAVALTVGIGYVAFDTAQRVATLSVFREGYGTPTKSPPEAFRAAEWNILYLFGWFIGAFTGIGLGASLLMWRYLLRSRRATALGGS